MKNNEKMVYYEPDDFVFAAKRGASCDIGPIYLYNHEDEEWRKFKRGDDTWGYLYCIIGRKGYKLTEKQLEKAKIPLITDETVFLDRG